MLQKTDFLKVTYILLLVAFSTNKTKASHVAGGDMNYTSLGGGKYKITVRIFRDCQGIAMGTPLGLGGVFAGTNGGNGCGTSSITFNRTAISDVTNYGRGQKAACYPVNSGFSGKGMEMHTFSATVDFNTTPLSNFVNKSSCCEVTFYAGECCRNPSMSTGGANTNLYLTCTINICNLSKCKNTEAKGPAVLSRPPTSLCCNEGFGYSFDFQDTAEGDSLSFALVKPLQGLPNTPVTYSSPYTQRYPATPYCIPLGKVDCSPNLKTNPYRGIFFDTVNTNFIFTPIKCDEIAVVVGEAKEWRKDTSGNWVWIGKLRREMLFLLRDDCGYNHPARLDSQYSYTVCAGDKIDFKIRVEDKVFTPFQTKRDTIAFFWDKAIPGATFTLLADTHPNIDTAHFVWQTKKEDAREYMYHFTYTVTDSSRKVPAIASRAVNIRVQLPDTSWMTISRETCNNLKLTASTGIGAKTNHSYIWKIQDSATGKEIYSGVSSIATTQQLGKGIYKISLRTKHPFYCYKEIIRYLHFDSIAPKVKLPADTTICLNGNSFTGSTVTGAEQPVQYKWLVNGSHTAGDTFPTHSLSNITTTRQLVLRITDAYKCSAWAYRYVFINSDPQTQWEGNIITVCHDTGDLFLDKYVNFGDSNNAQFWCEDPALFKSQGNNHFLKVSSTDNSLLQAGASKSVKVYCSFTSSKGCYSKDSTLVKINGTPIIEIKDKTLCQDIGKIRADSFVIKPLIKTGMTEYWRAITAPVGVNKSLAYTKTTGLWYFNFGAKKDTVYKGNYLSEYRVQYNFSGCDTRDTSTIKVINEAAFSFPTPYICDHTAEFSLLQSSRLDGALPPAPPGSKYNIKSFNYKTSDPKVSGTSLKDGYIFPAATAGVGHWTFDFSASLYGCPMSDTFGIFVYPTPIAVFSTTPKDTATANNPKFNTTNTSSIAGNTTLKYFWNFGTGNPADTSNSTSPVITYPAQEGTYNAMMVAISNKGCRDTVLVKLQIIKGNSSVDIPELQNAWIDNYFRIHGVEFRSLESRIFDASGRLVSSFANNSGETLPAGIYYYQIHFVFANGNTAMLKGSIQIQH